MRSRSMLTAAFLWLALAAAPLRAQSGDAIDLGDGLSVRRVPTWCGAAGVPIRCYAWQPSGFAFPAGPLSPALTFARTFARVPRTGRLLASVANVSGPFMYTGFAVRMLRSDDRGASWVPVTWRWVETAALIAFEPGSARGVAAGDSGYVWTTDDGGETWRDRGSSSGTTFTELATVPGEVVLVDGAGNVWRMSGGSFARELLLTDTSAHVTTEGDALVVRSATEELRIRHGHGVDRHRR